MNSLHSIYKFIQMQIILNFSFDKEKGERLAPLQYIDCFEFCL
ncbi:hypothetical protein HMPREF9096_01379 [Haemophilus sp. oral taxon 851 str. F0397]|nr:hypothetical protein HMPREF9096_01379 [Haemophilus sp. oral taxon 851 str. F0397]